MQLINALMALAMFLAPVPHVGDAGAEACIAQVTNSARTSAGQPSLPLDAQLSDEARAHSEQMASSSTLYHSAIRQQYGSQWKFIGENVGTNNSCDVVQQAFMSSPHHYDNIVKPVWTSFGTGVVVGDHGTVWVTVAFVQGTGGTTPPPAPAPVPTPAPPAPAPIKTTAAPPPATRPAPTRAAPVAPPAPVAPAPTAPVTPAASAPAPPAKPSSTATVLPAEAALARANSGPKGPPTAVIGLIAALALSFGAVGTWAVRVGSKRWRA